MSPETSTFERAVALAHEIEAQTGYPPALDDGRLGVADLHVDCQYVDESFETVFFNNLPPQQSHDSAARAVAAAAVYQCCFPDRAALRQYLERLAPTGIDDLSRLRWELHAAAIAWDLGRVLAIGRRIEDLEPTAENIYLIAQDAFYCLAHLDFPPSALDPDIHFPDFTFHQIYDLLVFSWALVVAPPQNDAHTWRDLSQLDAEGLNGALSVDSLASRVELSGPLAPTLCAIRCWCRFALASGRSDLKGLRSVGLEYLGLPPHLLNIESARLEGRKLSLAAAFQCSIRGQDFSSAVTAAREWTAIAPSDLRAKSCLVEALYKDNRIPETVAALEEWVKARQDDSEDWQASLLLQLGLEVLDVRRMAAAIETAAFTAPFRRQGEELIRWFVPYFGALPAKTRERLWVGVYKVSCPELAINWEDARWNQAGDDFGEAVALALKELVILPFQSANADVRAPDDGWKRVLEGKGTLGQLIECMLQARFPNHQSAKQLAAWLDENKPSFKKYLSRTPPQRLLAFNKLRGQAQHDAISENEARKIYSEAIELLKVLSE